MESYSHASGSPAAVMCSCRRAEAGGQKPCRTKKKGTEFPFSGMAYVHQLKVMQKRCAAGNE